MDGPVRVRVRPTPLTPHLSLRCGNNCVAERPGDAGGRRAGAVSIVKKRSGVVVASSGWSVLSCSRVAAGSPGRGAVGVKRARAELVCQGSRGPEASAACFCLLALQVGGPPGKPSGLRSGREDGRRRAFFALEKKETPRAACMHLRD